MSRMVDVQMANPFRTVILECMRAVGEVARMVPGRVWRYPGGSSCRFDIAAPAVFSGQMIDRYNTPAATASIAKPSEKK